MFGSKWSFSTSDAVFYSHYQITNIGSFIFFKVNRSFSNNRQSYPGSCVFKSKAAQTEYVNNLSATTGNNDALVLPVEFYQNTSECH